jgi:serine/threonine protein kinase/tetratricopeptide (TPR) repeat protein
MPVDPNRARDVFLAAVELAPELRPGYLADACGGDADLRAEVDRLLAANADPDSIFEGPPPTLAHTVAASAADAPGPTVVAAGEAPPEGAAETLQEVDPDATRARGTTTPKPRLAGVSTGRPIGSVIAGRYTLVELIGEGGMGSVYRASQSEPVRRDVALKLVRTGMDSREVLARFDAERQALALMDHPNIARVYDGGTTESGQPFFVMELVNGVAITRYCDQKRLSVRARLELFVAVCQAVQHAHQKGIIHRDLKPGNLLVTEVDGRPTPKVIDFGVAKATEVKLTELSFADVGAIVGTPTYMSPEQADPSAMDIDTRTDVYALGVLLYELLAGSPPIDAAQFRRGAVLEMLRMVREVDPPRPSTRVSTAEALPNIAAERGIDPVQLKRALTGDLDWIVMKALEKDRSRRYETANSFAADILRHLSNEPVTAAPPSRTYRLRKTVRKHRGAVIAASLVLFFLLAGIAGTTWGLFEARRSAKAERLAKLEADARRVEAEKQQRRAEAGEKLASERLAEVETEKKIAIAVRTFLHDKLLGQADVMKQADELLAAGRQSSEAKRNPTIRELLDRAADEVSEAKIESVIPNEPLVQAEVLNTIGNCYHAIGEYERAIEFLKRAAAIRRARLGPEHPGTLESNGRLAVVYGDFGRLDLALPLMEETLRIQKATLGPEHRATLSTMNNIGVLYKNAGKTARAIGILEDVVKVERVLIGDEDPGKSAAMNNLAFAYREGGRLDQAVSLFEETLALEQTHLGPEHPRTLVTATNLGTTYQLAGKPEATPLLERTLRLMQAKLGPDHPITLVCMSGLARAYKEFGRLDEAVPLYEETLKLSKAALGRDDRDTLDCMNHLALAYKEAGKGDLVLPLLEEAFTGMKAKLGPRHPKTLSIMVNLAQEYQNSGQPERALPLFEEALELSRAEADADDRETRRAMSGLATAYLDAGKLALALPLFEESLKGQQEKPGADLKLWVATISNLGNLYWREKQFDKSIPLYEKALKAQEKNLGPLHLETLYMKVNLGVNYNEAGRVAEAITLLEAAYRELEKLDPGHRTTGFAMHSLAGAYRSAGKLELAQRLCERAVKLQRDRLGPGHPDTLRSMNDLALNYRLLGKLDQAIALGSETLEGLKAALGLEHLDTLTTMDNLADAYQAAGKLDRALPLVEQVVKLKKATLRPEHPDTLESMKHLAVLYWRTRELDRSIPLFEELAKIEEQRLGPNHSETIRIRANLGVNYKDAGRIAEALPLLEQGYQAAKKPGQPNWVFDPLFDCYLCADKTEQATALVLDMLSEYRHALPKDSPALAGQLASLSLCLLKAKAFSEAEPLLRECLATREKNEPNDWRTFNTQSLLGGALLGQQRFAEAEPLLLKGYEGMKQREAEIPEAGKPRLTMALEHLVRFSEATDKPGEAARWRKELDARNGADQPPAEKP